MTRSSLFISLGLSLALAAGAGAATKAAGHKAGHAGAKTLTGCLENGDTAGTFKLTHVAGAADKDWELVEGSASLKMSEHVGHKVEVSGSTMGMAAAAKAEGTTASKEAAEHEHHLKVTSMKHMAATCP